MQKRLKRTWSSRNPTLDMCAGLLVLLHRAGPGSKAEKTAMKIFTDMFEASAAEHLLRCLREEGEEGRCKDPGFHGPNLFEAFYES